MLWSRLVDFGCLLFLLLLQKHEWRVNFLITLFYFIVCCVIADMLQFSFDLWPSLLASYSRLRLNVPVFQQ